MDLLKQILILGLVIFILFCACSCENDPCSDLVCQNGEICIDGVCECPDGFSGMNCEIEDLCVTQNIDCQNGGICIDSVCECPDGFSGVNCEFVEWTEPFEGLYVVSGFRATHDWVTSQRDTVEVNEDVLVEIRESDQILSDSTGELHIRGLKCIMNSNDSTFRWDFTGGGTCETNWMSGYFYAMDSIKVKRYYASSCWLSDQTIHLWGRRF